MLFGSGRPAGTRVHGAGAPGRAGSAAVAPSGPLAVAFYSRAMIRLQAASVSASARSTSIVGHSPSR